jgi:vacuolar-type H+-ATPase subunit F/Vma7
MSPQDRQFLAVIGDEEYVAHVQTSTLSTAAPTTGTSQALSPRKSIISLYQSSVTGLLLAGVGHVTEPPDAQRNFLVVDHKTETSQIEKAFTSFTTERKDVGIVLINQHVCFPSQSAMQQIALPDSGTDVCSATRRARPKR